MRGPCGPALTGRPQGPLLLRERNQGSRRTGMRAWALPGAQARLSTREEQAAAPRSAMRSARCLKSLSRTGSVRSAYGPADSNSEGWQAGGRHPASSESSRRCGQHPPRGQWPPISRCTSCTRRPRTSSRSRPRRSRQRSTGPKPFRAPSGSGDPTAPALIPSARHQSSCRMHHVGHGGAARYGYCAVRSC